ncbi:MAG: hypothetical protein AAGM38_11865 [Pseudomonadota bacterium]
MSLGGVALGVAGLLFAIFFTNVALGAAGAATFLTDVEEMLTLLASAGVFVACVLLKEAKAAKDADLQE